MIPPLSSAAHKLQALKQFDETLGSLNSMLEEAKIFCSEATDSLRDYLQSMDNDPRSLDQIDQRLGLLHSLARKHRCEPEALLSTLEDLQSKIGQLQNQEAIY